VIKLIVLAIGVWIVYRILKGYSRSVGQERPTQVDSVEDMVRCTRCGVHLPRSESILSQGKFYCSEEHRKLQQR
jgi:uncharacterized protein